MSEGSVTHWIRLLQAGDVAGAQPLWERYFEQLARFCQRRLAGGRPCIADGEDVALSVLDTVCRRAGEKRFPNLSDRDNLWKLLVVIAARKVANVHKHEGRVKRGAGRVGVEIAAGDESNDGLPLESLIGVEPTAELAAVVTELLTKFDGLLPNGKLRQIAELKLEGYENREIADQVGCSIPTIERKLRLIRREFQDNFRS